MSLPNSALSPKAAEPNIIIGSATVPLAAIALVGFVLSAAAQVEHEGLVPRPRAHLQRGRVGRQREAND